MAESESLSSAGFSGAQFRRLLLPGLIAAVGLHAYKPLTAVTTFTQPLDLDKNVVFLIEVILFGFLISSAARPIFYLYEGFRLPWLTFPAKLWNSGRLRRRQLKLQDLYAQGEQESEEAERIQSYLFDFPYRAIKGGFIFEAERPTRIGNLIASYELYPKRVYGIDAVFFWNHLTFLAPKEIRDDVDEKSSLAESILLSSAAGAGISIIAIFVFLFHVWEAWHLKGFLTLFPEGTWPALYTFLFGAVSFVAFQRLSLPAYREYRDSFRTMVDLAMPEFTKWLSKAPVAPPAALKEDAEKVEDYLRTLAPHRRGPRKPK